MATKDNLKRINEISEQGLTTQTESVETKTIRHLRLNSLKQKILTGTLLVGLLGGCQGAQDQSEVKSSNPVEPDPIEVVLPEEAEDVVKIRPMLAAGAYSSGYEFNFSGSLFEEVASYKEREDEGYFIFLSKIIDHSDWVWNFVDSLENVDLDYTTKALPAIEGTANYLDQTLHYWKNEGSTVFYNVENDSFYLNFDKPVYLKDFSINPTDKEAISLALSEMNKTFFTEDFEYQVEEITQEGEYYRVEYRRVLDAIPIIRHLSSPFLLLSQDGGIKEARFLLAEFERSSQVNLISEESFRENIGNRDYNRSVLFSIKNFDDYERLGLESDSSTGKEKGKIEAENIRLVYRFEGKYEGIAVPVFLIEGDGNIELNGEKADASFIVFANALALEHLEK